MARARGLYTAALPMAFMVLAAQGTLEGAPGVILRVPPVSGEPGQEVTFEFRTTMEEPIVVAFIGFELDGSPAEFLRTTVEGTASAHAAPRGIVYNPAPVRGGLETGVRFDTQSPYGEVGPGEDLILVKAVFRIRPDAAPGNHALRILRTDITLSSLMTAVVEVADSGALTILPPSGPRPVSDLKCVQDGSRVRVSWVPTESTYDGIVVTRSGAVIATLSGSPTDFDDEPAPGPASYGVTAVRGGKESLASRCDLLVQVPRPPPVEGLTCSPSGGLVALSWSNRAPYDSIEVLRNGRRIAALSGSTESHADAYASDLFTVYTVRAAAGGVEAFPTNCQLNALSTRFVFWAEDVLTRPGAPNVAVRIFGTNPEKAQGLQLGLRIDPSFAVLRELTLEGTACEDAGYDQFLYQRHVLDRGETACGIYFDTVPPYGNWLPPGADQHILTVIVDIREDAPSGASVKLDLDGFGSPPARDIFDLGGRSQETESQDGAVLIGESPVPGVGAARAEAAGEELGAGGAGGEAQEGIVIRWTNTDAYDGLRIERDGQALVDLPPDRISHFDAAPGPGMHRYRIYSRKGTKESFPVVVTTRPRGIPGTFLRGDANSDGLVNVADVVTILLHLFRGGAQPSCLDAVDADDNGSVNLTDPLTLLHFLFLGVGPLPTPGVEAAWFDPTTDELRCD